MAATPLLNLRLDPELVRRLDLIAQRRGTTRSDVVREAITATLEAEAAGPVPA